MPGVTMKRSLEGDGREYPREIPRLSGENEGPRDDAFG
jgi:hypothetical protein